MDREVLRNELIRDEGMKLVSYQDSVGLWTVGVGHLLGDRRRMTEITATECDALLERDVTNAEAIVRMLVYDYSAWQQLGVNQARSLALVNMAFNLGGRLGGFKKFLAAVNSNDWVTAGVEMANSTWAKQVGARAVRLRRMIETEVVT